MTTADRYSRQAECNHVAVRHGRVHISFFDVWTNGVRHTSSRRSHNDTREGTREALTHYFINDPVLTRVVDQLFREPTLEFTFAEENDPTLTESNEWLALLA